MSTNNRLKRPDQHNQDGIPGMNPGGEQQEPAAASAQREAGSKSSQWLRGAALLGGAALLSKVLGTLQKIPLQNLAGDRVFGIYNAVYPIYQLLLYLSTAGIPVAVSLMIARHHEAEDQEGMRRVLHAGLLLLACGGLLGCGLMWWLSGDVSHWLGDPDTLWAIRMASLGLWFVPAVGALRGYYQGQQQMLPSAVSQIAEQSLRVAVIVGMLLLGLSAGWSESGIAAGAMAGSAVGGVAGLVVLLMWARGTGPGSAWPAGGAARRGAGRAADASGQEARAAITRGAEYGRQRGALPSEPSPLAARQHSAAAAGEPGVQAGDHGIAAQPGTAQPSAAALPAAALPQGGRLLRRLRAQPLLAEMRRLALLAAPVAIGSLAVPIAGIVDAITVPRLLARAGASGAELMTQFGLYSRGQPLVQLVVMVAGSAAAALVPALAAARQRQDLRAAAVQAELMLRLTWWLGAAATVGLVWLAEPINVLLYADSQATVAFAWVSATALAGALNAVTAALLQGLGRVRLPALLLLVAALLKALLNAVLVPAYGIEGAAYAGVLALSAAALPGAVAAVRAAKAHLPARIYVAGTLGALACMAAALWLVERAYHELLGELPLRIAAAILALTGVAVGAAVFAAALIAGGGLSAREVRALPGGEKLAGLLRRMRLLRREE